MFPHFGGSPAVGALDEMGACDTAASGLEIDAQSTRHFANRRQPPPGPSPHSGPDFVPRRSLFRNASGWRTPISRKHLAQVMPKRKPCLRSSPIDSQTRFGVLRGAPRDPVSEVVKTARETTPKLICSQLARPRPYFDHETGSAV